MSTVVDVAAQQNLRTVLTLETSGQPDDSSFRPTPFTSQAVRDLCLAATTVMLKGDKERPLTVLLPTAELLSDPFIMNLESCLVAAGVMPSMLTLSLPEDDLLSVVQRGRTQLNLLAGWGVRLAVHDFGVRAAPLAVFEDFPVDAVYVHDTFAGRIAKTLRAPHYPLALVRALVEAATYLEFDLVASGVASLEAVRLLHSLGCVHQRGPFFEAALAAKGEESKNFDFDSGGSTSVKN